MARSEKKRYTVICLLSKYMFSLAFPLLCVCIHRAEIHYLIAAGMEVFIVGVLTNLLCRIKLWIGYIFNTGMLLVINVQFTVLYFSNTFVNTAMLTNLDSIQDLSGKAFEYGLSAVLVIIFSALPICRINFDKKSAVASILGLVILCGSMCGTGLYQYTSFYGTYQSVQQLIAWNQVLERAKQSAETESEFYKSEVLDFIAKPETVPELPNVILIFVEGLSQNIIEDPRDIMPNIRQLQASSIRFRNYYNHTFATYMGLSGQLYSGYQHQNYDVNYLISMQDIFSYYGYRTCFLNTEPMNEEFTQYLNQFAFDEVITDTNRLDGMADSLSDKAAYSLLFQTAIEEAEKGNRFFLSMYSFGTHVSLDGVYESYGDGRDPLLNKFFDLDTPIGMFMEKFSASKLAENTVLILTSDHATYQDADFITTFPDYKRTDTCIDSIPFLIYYQNAVPQEYDARGRNSLDLAPTVLDFLDMSAGNYFLGHSLFSTESESPYDTIYESSGSYACTKDGEIRYLTKEEQQGFETEIANYFVLKAADPSVCVEYPHIYASVNSDATKLDTELYNAEAWSTFHYAVWSDENGQDDLHWFTVTGEDKSPLLYSIDLQDYVTSGIYSVHVYAEEGDTSVFLCQARIHIQRPCILATINQNTNTLDTELHNAEMWDAFSYAVWSDENGQDDLHWYPVAGNQEPLLSFAVDLSEYTSDGTYFVHVYAKKEESDEFVFLTKTELNITRSQ